MSNVGYATLTVIPSAKGFASALSGDILGPMDSAGRDAGAKSGGSFVGAFKGLVGAGIAIAAGGMFSGFIAEAARASDATDKFKATMNFAGLDTSAIDAATKAAKEFADQTVYDLPTIQNTIAQLASNGVADYTGLTKAAGNLNAVAGGNAETFKSVAMVMTQTAGAGKLTTENWNQLSDAIPGAAGPLMRALEEAGAYTGNFRDAMAEGEVTADEFNAALMKLGTDPIAVEAAKSTATFEGALGNLQATINSGLMTALDAMKPAITGAINLLANGLGSAFVVAGNVMGTVTGAVRAFGNAWRENNGDVTSDGLAGVFEQVANAIRPLFGELGDFKVLWGEVTGGIRAFGAAWRENNGDVTSSGIPGFFERLANAIRPVFDALAPLGTVIASLVTQFSPLGIIFRSLEPVLPALLSTFTQLGVGIAGTLTVALAQLVPMIQVLVSHLSGVFVAIMPAVTAMVLTLGNAFTQLVPVVMSVLGALISAALSYIGSLWNVAWSGISSFLGGVWGNIASAVSSGIGEVVNFFSGLWGRVQGAIGDIGSKMSTIGLQMIQGLANGISGAANLIREAVAGAIGNVVDFAKSLLGIHSPSRVFMEIGDFTAQGMAIGLTKGAKHVEKAAAKSLVPAAPSFASPDVTAGGVRAGAEAGLPTGSPLIGSLTLQSSGNVREDMEEVLFHTRRIARGGVYA
ncbi:tape measure domain protein [Pseudarthrobacter siccitolerans]|uniref:Tape measure domain protein n=1 Tax=Pseudarthrobacter siccitolerans TaxID=861266 RepID=A0A024GY10_9MICC|nr:tape measure protein [Pseudarthrobacter siccitolerans]CCQ44663.1 tape measure domain protein [Pseudarthrobacter siccitolerans]